MRVRDFFLNIFCRFKYLLFLCGMETILTLNSGQHILFGYLLTSIEGRINGDLSLDSTIQLAELVIELTDQDKYLSPLGCPDVQIMVNPQNSFEIFCDWYDENETYFQEFLVERN